MMTSVNSYTPAPVFDWTGEKIDKPGIWRGVPIEEYHGDPCAGPSISSSGLRTIWSASPAHYYAYSPYNPTRWPRKSNDAFDLGKAAHHVLLGEEEFGRHFAVRPDEWSDWRTKAAQEWKAAQIAAGKTVLTPDDLVAIRGMRDGLVRNLLVQAGILDGEVERSMFVVDPETGIWLRSRPDVIPTASGDFSDLKTTVSVRRDDLAKSIADFGYVMQAALLRMVCRLLDVPFTSFSFVFVEKNPPYCARVVMLKDHELDRGEKQIRISLRMFAEGLRTGFWPGPDGEQSDAEYIEQPSWAQTRAENRLAELAHVYPGNVGVRE